MTRDQRVQDNFSLIYAQQLANEKQKPLFTVFNLVENFPNFNTRNAEFMIENLEMVEQTLSKLNIPMLITKGPIDQTLPKLIQNFNISVLITDFSPLSISKQWLQSLNRLLNIPIIVCDTHNIIPCWIASNKQEYSARTIRPKIHKLLGEFFTPLPTINALKYISAEALDEINWNKILEQLSIDKSVNKVTWLNSGEIEARKVLDEFINKKLVQYSSLKNDPTENVLSNLSSYFHFGQISAHRVAWEITNTNSISKSEKEVFLEELIVRKELADNYCYYSELIKRLSFICCTSLFGIKHINIVNLRIKKIN